MPFPRPPGHQGKAVGTGTTGRVEAEEEGGLFGVCANGAAGWLKGGCVCLCAGSLEKHQHE